MLHFTFKNTKQVFKKLCCLSRQRNNFCSQQEGLHETLIKWNIWTIPTPPISMMPKSHIFAPLCLHHCSARGGGRGGLIIPFFLSKIAGALTTWATYSIESLIKASSWFLFSKHIYSLAIMFIFRTCGRCIRKMDHHCPWFVHYTECTLQFNRLSISVYEFQLIYFILYRSSHDQSL